jgi:NAD(P)-dependent dehydrogenase (short-subunit alcohol dehydrogenase family)
VAWTRELGVERARDNIRVNAVAPGWIDVPRHHDAAPDSFDADDEARGQVPRGRAGRPIDVAHLCVYLASAEADFAVGQTFVIDGGTTALMSLDG